VRKAKNNKEKKRAQEVINILAKEESTILKPVLTGISANMLRWWIEKKTNEQKAKIIHMKWKAKIIHMKWFGFKYGKIEK
jgi:hypothetical protein